MAGGPDEAAGAAVRSTFYVNKYFELREGVPVKYVYAGDRRVARITGSVSDGGARLQRLVLVPSSSAVNGVSY
jgi:hypothetical protein